MRVFVLGAGWLMLFLPSGILCASPLVYGGLFNQPIPAQGDGRAAMDPVTINVHDHFTISDLDVLLNITHTDVSDLEIQLLAPFNDLIILKTCWEPIWIPPDRYPRIDMADTFFDDAAALFITEGQPPYTGRFRPEEGSVLSIFNGREAYGAWTLKIFDHYYGNSGTLLECKLYFNSSPAPEPGPLACLAGLCFMLRRRRLSRP